MENKNKRVSNSAFGYHQINWLTYMVYRLLSLFSKKKEVNLIPTSPVLITGLFRSGTSVTAEIIKSFGFSAGPEDHLLRNRNTFVNQKEFLENYFFMDLSLYLFHKTNSWGDAPPSNKSLENIVLKNENRHEIARFSLLKIHDSRISNYNKLKVLLENDIRQPEIYSSKYFSGKSFIKNPHISILLPFFRFLFPSSKIIFVFKNPYNAVMSAKKVSTLADYNLYFAYYSDGVKQHEKGNSNIIFFSHEHLVKSPETSVQKLGDRIGSEKFDLNKICEKIEKSNNQVLNLDVIPDNVKHLYEYMLRNSINKTND